MFDIDNLQVDPVLAVEGVWVDYLRGSKLKIARVNNSAAEAYRLRQAIENAELFNAGGDKAEALAAEVETHALAYHVLLDWQGIERAGKPLKYTAEVGAELLADPRFHDFREDVLRLARNREQYRHANETQAIDGVKATAAS